jgi:hypothetical protein
MRQQQVVSHHFISAFFENQENLIVTDEFSQNGDDQ